jgi:hypothetical protein
VTVLRRKLDVMMSDNENLLTAVKYLRAKVEGSSTGATTSSAMANNLLASVAGDVTGSAIVLRERLSVAERENENLRRRLVGLGEIGKDD